MEIQYTNFAQVLIFLVNLNFSEKANKRFQCATQALWHTKWRNSAHFLEGDTHFSEGVITRYFSLSLRQIVYTFWRNDNAILKYRGIIN